MAVGSAAKNSSTYNRKFAVNTIHVQQISRVLLLPPRILPVLWVVIGLPAMNSVATEAAILVTPGFVCLAFCCNVDLNYPPAILAFLASAMA